MFNAYRQFDDVVHIHALLDTNQLNCYLARSREYVKHFPWSTALLPLFHLCMVHVSPHIPGKVAYFSSIDAMLKNIPTRTSPEMFLERYLKYAPIEVQACWQNEVMGHIIPSVHFVENDNPAGWLRVYHDGPGSCMSHSDKVKAYAHPGNNLALAYVEDNGKITHRTIVNKKKKTYLQIYGNYLTTGFFVAALNKLGYQRDYDSLEGELINVFYKPCERCDDSVAVGPYFDGSANRCHINSQNNEEGVITSERGTYLDSEHETFCSSCDGKDHYDDDDDEDDDDNDDEEDKDD